MPSWDSIPESQRAFQRRLMEIYAGFVEHTDAQAGRLIDELEQRGLRDNTIVIYIFGDNGASAEGQNGTISELLAQNNIPNTVEQQIAALDRIGGLDALGSPKTDNMYHAGWAWAGNTPFQDTKLVASHFGGTRNPMVISWPKGIKPDKTPRSQFHHVNDIVPTIYEVLGITPPKVVDGYEQDPIDGVSLAYTFADAKAPTHKKVQYFDNNGSRGIYQDGWFGGHLRPADAVAARSRQDWPTGIRRRTSGSSTTSRSDFSQADDLAAKEPAALAQLQKAVRRAGDGEQGLSRSAPASGCACTRKTGSRRPYTSWHFDATTTRMPEFTAPGIGRQSNTVTIDAEFGANASGVLYALGGSGGGLTLFMDEGHACLRIQHDDHRALRRAVGDEDRRPASTGSKSTTTIASAKPVAGRCRPHSRRQGSGAHDREPHRARRLHGQRNVRRRRRPRLDRLARLLRPQAV